MSDEKILKIPPCAVRGECDILSTFPRNGHGVEAVAKVNNPYIWPFGWDVAILIFSDCDDFDPSRAAITSNGVEAEMKNQKENARRVTVTLTAEQSKQYSALLAIVRKFRGDVTASEMLAPLMPEPDFVAGCVLSDWCESDDERVALRDDLKAAGLLAW